MKLSTKLYLAGTAGLLVTPFTVASLLVLAWGMHNQINLGS